MLIGFFCFFIYYFRLQKTERVGLWRSAAWLLPYLGGIGILSYLGTFGNGKSMLTFGWDFLVIAIFTVVIFYLALYSGRTSKEMSFPTSTMPDQSSIDNMS